MLFIPLLKRAPGLYVKAFDVQDVRRNARHIDAFQRLLRVARVDLLVSLDSDRLARGAVADDRVGGVRVDLRIAAQHFEKLVKIGCDRELGYHKSIRPEVRDLLFPIAIQALDDRDYCDDRGDPDDDAEQRQERAKLI